MIFMSDKVTSKNHCCIASRVTKTLSLTLTNILFDFSHAILCHDQTNPLKTIIDRSFRYCRREQCFLTWHCDITII